MLPNLDFDSADETGISNADQGDIRSSDLLRCFSQLLICKFSPFHKLSARASSTFGSTLEAMMMVNEAKKSGSD